MASYGVFLAACGFEYDGPKAHIGFAPKLTPGNFRAPFTAAESWGTYSQQFQSPKLKFEFAVKWGNLRLRSVALAVPDAAMSLAGIAIKLNGSEIESEHHISGRRLAITLADEAIVSEGQTLEITI
jgi:hypothetical protein